MNGYETKQLRDAHLDALHREKDACLKQQELAAVKQERAEGRNDAAEAARYGQVIADAEARCTEVNKQISVFSGQGKTAKKR